MLTTGEQWKAGLIEKGWQVDQSSIHSFVPFTVISGSIGIVAFLLAREKGRNVVLWTVLGLIPVVNFAAMCYFVGAANLVLERKIDQLLKGL